MKNIFLGNLLLIVLALPVLAAPSPVSNAEIEKVVLTYVEHGRFSGVVLVQDGPAIIHFNSYGMAVREHNVANDLESVFRIGSLSKQFVAAQILQLQEKGKLSIDDPLSKFLEIPPPWQGITLHHLLTHTSGLQMDIPLTLDLEAVYHTPEALFESAKTAPLAHSEGPGKQFEYLNMGYSLLALVIQHVTRSDYQNVFEKVFTKSLALMKTGIDHDSHINSGMSVGYNKTPDVDARSCCFDMSNSFGAGDVRSTAMDLSQWIDILLNNHFLNKTSLETMWSPHIQMSSDGKPIDSLYYGYGWAIDKRGGRTRIVHNGSVPGYVSDVAIWPSENKRIIVLSNVREYSWSEDHTRLIPISTASLMRTQIEKVLFQ